MFSSLVDFSEALYIRREKLTPQVWIHGLWNFFKMHSQHPNQTFNILDPKLFHDDFLFIIDLNLPPQQEN